MTLETLTHQTAISNCAELTAFVDQFTRDKGDGEHTTLINGLQFIRRSDALLPMHGISKPILAIVVQGKKEVLLSEETYQYSVAQYFVVSVDLPICGFAINATPEQPYLGLILDLDPVQLGEIIAQTDQSCDLKNNSVRGWFIGNANSSLIDCITRLVRLLATPQDIPFLAPMIIRELYYRLLLGEQGEAVRQIATSGSTMRRIAEAIKQIKDKFAQPLRIEDLAASINMSPASFHRHFKEVTGVSPLQYQKQIRLLTARQLMLSEDANAARAASQVGYESSSQFSREYARLFGAPPIKDIERLRIA